MVTIGHCGHQADSPVRFLAKPRSAERSLHDIDLVVKLAQPLNRLCKAHACSAIRTAVVQEPVTEQLETISLLLHALKHLRTAATNSVREERH
jgi:hypothetical protein